MDGRFRRLMMPEADDKFQFIIEGLRTKEEKYKIIEKRWKVFLPFNKNDLEDYL